MTALNKQALRKELGICSKDRMRRIALALLDELEAMQKTSEARREAILRTHKMFQKQMDRAVSADKRIAELEARTVTLPVTGDVHPLAPYEAKIFFEFKKSIVQECANAIRAAGIGVKGE